MEGTRIVLIRHGESRAQELGILGGHAGCQGLSATGRRQVTLLRDRLASTGELVEASALYSSVMPRAVETAQIIAPALGDLEVWQECDFCEGHPGEADGLTWEELAERYPVEPGWSGNTQRAPGWETWTELGDRVARALSTIVDRHPGETIVVACHGGVVAHAMFHFLGLDLDPRGQPRAWIAPDNSSLTEFRFAPNPYEKSTLPVQLVRYNDHAHLAAAAGVGDLSVAGGG
ncbi:MAG TPA: histidine phosphatase family protein [Ornithinibacter sp.]|nr:histidine phosphatase family protein [Ornithinibacter sp.]